MKPSLCRGRFNFAGGLDGSSIDKPSRALQQKTRSMIK